MNKQVMRRSWALAAVLALGGFATASASMSVDLEPRSNVIYMATVVFCDKDGDGQVEHHEVCVGGRNGGFGGELVDTTLSAIPVGPLVTPIVGL